MTYIRVAYKNLLLGSAMFSCLFLQGVGYAADHNDPNAINSIFADIPVSAADLYDMFGFPSDDKTGGEKVVVALTFASVPKTGVFDTDMLYKINFDPDPRTGSALSEESSLAAMLKAIANKYLELKPSEVKVTFSKKNQAKVDFINFPGGDFSKVLETNQAAAIESPDGFAIKAFFGG